MILPRVPLREPRFTRGTGSDLRDTCWYGNPSGEILAETERQPSLSLIELVHAPFRRAGRDARALAASGKECASAEFRGRESLHAEQTARSAAATCPRRDHARGVPRPDR